jgi:ADP-dependent NAD(P)H-hydrate dehydratase
MKSPTPTAVDVDTNLLHSWPLPQPEPDSDKEARGQVVVIAGSREMPGAALLAGHAALRAGAGRLIVATGASVAQGLALVLPEARVLALAESRSGGLLPEGVEILEPVLHGTQSVLVGPGMQDEDTTRRFVQAVLPFCADATVVLDALAMHAMSLLGRLDQPVLLTPHAGEMAKLTDADKAAVLADAKRYCIEAAARWNAVIALKGQRTWIAGPQGIVCQHNGGNIGLATSGSGDVLAGLIAGLAARGASLVQAAIWGVALHARAGLELTAKRGPLGFLAGELAGEVPRLMDALASVTGCGSTSEERENIKE